MFNETNLISLSLSFSVLLAQMKDQQKIHHGEYTVGWRLRGGGRQDG